MRRLPAVPSGRASSGLLSPLSVSLLALILIVSCAACHARAETNSASSPTGVPAPAGRVRNEPESVWVEFIQLAQDHKPLNLGQGFPDFAAPSYLVEALRNLTNQATEEIVLSHQYTRSFGHPRLVRALRDYYKEHRGFEQLTDERSQLLVTVGAYEALFSAVMAFVGPGDEVLIIDPAFDAYAPMVAMAGGTSVFVPLRAGKEQPTTTTTSLSSAQFTLDLDEVRSKVNSKTRAIILNSPNNPMGKVFSRQELAELAKICENANLLVIADEVYEQFYYEPYEHVSMASLPGMWNRTITIGSAGKTFSVTGWKIGWAFGPTHLIKYMQLVHQTAVYTVATPLQEALAVALERENSGEALVKIFRAIASARNSSASPGGFESLRYWSALRTKLRKYRDKMAQILERAHMKPIVPQGGYFMLADFSSLANSFPDYKGAAGLGDPAKNNTINTNDYMFARWLSRVKHLQGIPGGAFYSEANKALGKNLIRFCFIKSKETMDEFEKLMDGLIASMRA